MRGHAWTRVQDPALLTSTNHTYQFMQLDVLTNVAMRGNDSRLVLHRGFAEKQSASEGVAFRNREENDNEELYKDDVENFSNIHKLTRLFETSLLTIFTLKRPTILQPRELRFYEIGLQVPKRFFFSCPTIPSPRKMHRLFYDRHPQFMLKDHGRLSLIYG